MKTSLSLLALFGSALMAQDLAQFTAESRLSISQFQSTSTLSISQTVLDSVEAGASELRQQVNYDPSQKLVHVVGFEVAANAPLPTPSVAVSSTLWAFDVRIDSVLLNEGVANGVVMTGSYLTGESPFSNVTPSSAVISFTYSGTDSFQGISVSLVGAGTTFASAGAGKIGVQRSTVTAIASPRGAVVTAMQFTLDGRRSSTTAAGGLTYEWQFLPAAGQVVAFTGENSAVLTVTLQEGNPFVYGDYTFRLTVKNAAGITASDTVTVSVLNPSDN